MNRLKLFLLAMIGVFLLSACQSGGEEYKTRYEVYEDASHHHARGP